MAMIRQGQTGSSTFNIWVANADGSGLRQVTFGAGEVDPSWSPDGHHIVFVGSAELDILNVDDPADTPHSIPGTDGQANTPVWSPDGSLIAYEHGGTPDQLVVVQPDGGGFRVINSAPTSPSQLIDRTPAWAPDSSRVYFAQGRALVVGCFSNPPFQIMSVSRDGGTTVPFSHDPSVSEYGPAPSPDGKLMAFTRCDDPADDLQHIYVSGLDGSAPHAVTSGDHYDNQPNWQPIAPQIGSPPTITGNAVNNQTLTATAGAADGTSSTTLQFVRCNAQGASCLPIPGASASRAHASAATARYKLTSTDLGHAIRLHEVDTNTAGSTTTDSAPTRSVAPSKGHCSNRFAGTAKADKIRGSRASDRISGGRGKDRLSGLGGADCISGGAGNDTLSGGKGNDTISGGAGNDKISAGPGKNKVSGGAGNDRINVRNHKRDVVNCGTGKKDRVVADKVDKLRGCEHVKRR
jgi:Ca2+-binding RTX toxin-like protein